VKELYSSSRIYCQLCGRSHDPEGIPRAPAPERSMKATFYLIDLVSQCAAVERRLAGMSEAQKIDWLSAHGRLAPFPKHEGPQVLTRWRETNGAANGMIGTTVSLLALMAAPVACSAGRSADSQWAAEGLRRSFRPGRAKTGLQQKLFSSKLVDSKLMRGRTATLAPISALSQCATTARVPLAMSRVPLYSQACHPISLARNSFRTRQVFYFLVE
jgi:hypothetical protein